MGNYRWLTQRKKAQVNSVLAWTDAFLVFTSVFLSAHPGRSQELLKYMHVIRTAAARFPGRGWLEYDRQFRMRQQLHPTRSWATIDGELWALYMSAPGIPPVYPAGPKGNQGARRVGSSFRGFYQQNTRNAGLCFAFNRSTCSNSQCRYAHKCLGCNGVGHGLATCKARKSNPSPTSQ